ncbi:MAG: hypothetical protein J6M62_03550, partial [Selenomonadaceae bacterium]|nr:hypothetical protein [Selenomonadaceae bacterium]
QKNYDKDENNAFFFKNLRSCKDFWFSDDGIALIAGWTREGHTVEAIANKMGISKPTLYKWSKNNIDIFNALKKNLQVCNERVISTLYQKCLDGDVTAIKYWLANRAAKDWRDKQEIAVEGDLPVILVDNVKK